MAAGAGFQRAVQALFWMNLALAGVIFATAPVDLPPSAQKEVASLWPSSTCAPQMGFYSSAVHLRYFLLLGVLATSLLIAGIHAKAGGDPTKDGGPATTPVGLRMTFLLAVALTAAGTALAVASALQFLQLRMGIFLCFSGAARAVVYASSAATGAAVVWTLGSIAIRGMLSQ